MQSKWLIKGPQVAYTPHRVNCFLLCVRGVFSIAFSFLGSRYVRDFSPAAHEGYLLPAVPWNLGGEARSFCGIPVRNHSAEVWGIHAPGIKTKLSTLCHRCLILPPIKREGTGRTSGRRRSARY